MKKVLTKEFVSPIVRQTFSGSMLSGTGECTMILTVDGDRGSIEWDIPNLGEFAEIGLRFGGGELLAVVGYGVATWLPSEAIELIEEAGFKVGDEFR